MLADRHFEDLPHSRVGWSVTSVLCVTNLLIFALQFLAINNGWKFEEIFSLRPDELIGGRLWQIFTFQFLHDNWLHLLLNCTILWWFGRQMEAFLGRGSFIKLYLSAGAIGGLAQVIWTCLFDREMTNVAVVGASAGVCGLVAAYAALNWDQQFVLSLFTFRPFTTRGKYLALLLVISCVIEVFYGFDDIAHAAHFGGIWVGLVYIRWIIQAERFWGVWEELRARVKPRPLIERVELPAEIHFETVDDMPEAEILDDLPAHEFIEREVDPVLEKISAHGIESLTEREKRILDRAHEIVSGKN
jgi:membrane associated rhomboid family serine protease